jgi:hypothetical protein
LQEDDNASFSSPTERYSGAGTSWNASGKDTGTYYYRVRASNSWGNSAWSNVQSVGVYPTRLSPTADAMVLQGFPGSNFGSYSYLEVGYDHCESDQVARSLIQFDLSSIPAWTPISSARLYFYNGGYCDYANRNHTVTAYRNTGSWSEMGVTWNNKPAFAGASGSVSVPSMSYGWRSIDVTALVRGWVNGGYANYGLTLRGPESTGDSSALLILGARTSDYPPYLNIEYSGMAAFEEALPAPPVLYAPANEGGEFSWQMMCLFDEPLQ